MIEPRYAWVPQADRSLGEECIAFWKAAGGSLFEWQERVIVGMLGVRADGKWASTEDGLDVARQNGKGVILQAIELFCLFDLGFQVVVHTAHEFATAQQHFMRIEDVIRNCPQLHSRVKERGGYMHANGKDSINLKTGEQLIFKARTKDGGRGYSGWVLIWDEAMDIPDEVVGAQMPMLRACPSPLGPKIIFAGSAVDQEVHQHGVNFARIRERGIAESPRTSWHEWSAPFDHPSQMTEDLLTNSELWPLGNPSMADGLVSSEYMADEIARMPSRTAAVELVCVGDWPRTDGFDDTIISLEAWDALEDQKSKLQEPWCLAFDVSPERRTSIAIAGRNQDDLFHVEVQECRPGTGWAVDRIVEIVEKGQPEMVVCDAVGPASSLLLALKDLGVKVETVNSTEHGQACGRLVDMVNDGTLAHLGSSELRDAIRGSKVRQLGDAWAWSRKSSSVDISPLVAATLALGAAAGVGIGGLAIW